MAEQVFKKDADSFYYNASYTTSDCRSDYVGDSELTVRITLHEYRQMVWTIAKHDEKVREKDDEIRKVRGECNALKEQLDALVETLGSRTDVGRIPNGE